MTDPEKYPEPDRAPQAGPVSDVAGPNVEGLDSDGGKVTTRPETASVAGPASGPSRTGRRGLLRFLPDSTLLRNGLVVLLAYVGVMLLVESLSPFRVTQIAAMAYYVPAVAGLTLLTGINGQISLGHGALMAVGAYTTALLLDRESPLPYLVIVLIALVVTSLVGVIVGAAASRLHGPYLAGATLAFAVGLPGLAIYMEETLGGEQGISVPPPRAGDAADSFFFFLTGSELTVPKYTAYVTSAIALVVLLLLANLIRSRFGRMWRAIRDDEVAASLAGINLGPMRVLAFTVSAAAAGIAGAMLAVVTRLVAPTSFTVVLSIFLLVAIVVGGLGSLLGAVIGSALLVFFVPFVTNQALDAGLSSAQAANLAPLVFGVFLVVIMLAAPQGIVGTIRVKWLTRQARRRLAAAQQ